MNEEENEDEKSKREKRVAKTHSNLGSFKIFSHFGSWHSQNEIETALNCSAIDVYTERRYVNHNKMKTPK